MSTAAAAAASAWGGGLPHKRLLSLASLWAFCEIIAVRVFFEADYTHWRSAHDAAVQAASAAGGGGGSSYNSKRRHNNNRRGRSSRRGGQHATDDAASLQPAHPSMQQKLSEKKPFASNTFHYSDDDYTELSKSSLDFTADIDTVSGDGNADARGDNVDEWDDDGGTTFHIFQIAKPHTGSTLLNCILQGLLDEPFEKYNFLPAVKPTDGGRFGPYPQGITESDAQVQDEPYPFILHDGRLKMSQENMDVTAVTKTHVVDVDELEEEFGHLFDDAFYVAANRAEKGIGIDAEYCEYDNVLCFDYDDFAYKPDEIEDGDSLEVISDIVRRVKAGLEHKFPLLRNVEMSVEEATKRVKLMEKATEEMAGKSFKEHEPYFGIHGGHRNRDDNNGAKRNNKKTAAAGIRGQSSSTKSTPINLVHLYPAYKVSDCDMRFCPYDQDQSVAIASMQKARTSAKKASVTLAASVFPEDADVVPSDFIRLDDLTRSTLTDYPHLSLEKKLPFINDIFDNLRNSDQYEKFDYVIYTNSDIIVTENFYDIVATAISSGYDAFTINRQTVPKNKPVRGGGQPYTALDLDDIHQLTNGKTHPGSDCFVFHRSAFEKIQMGNLFLGYPPTANVLLVQAESLAEKYTMFASNELKATYHLGDDKAWHDGNDASLEYEMLNYESAYNDLHQIWSSLCQFSVDINDSRRHLMQQKYVGNTMSCSRLANKFSTVAGYDLATEYQPSEIAAAGGRLQKKLNKLVSSESVSAPTLRNSAVDSSSSPIVFQFLVGLEGTGHHLHQKLYKGSPAHKRLKAYGLLDDVGDLLKSLWNREKPSKGLWSATCALANEEENKWWKQENENTDGERLFNNLVGHLKSLEDKARGSVEDDDTTMGSEDLVIAVNSGSIYNQEAAPFLSYPLLHGPCRFLQYPVLDIFYEACDAAGVRCQHAMSFRDPYRTLRSTSMNRNFASRHVQLQTLHSMLGIIQGQMLSHPDRNVACWESDMGADGGAGDLGVLFGWKNPARFEEFYNKIFLEPSALSDEDRLEITKEKQLEVYMNSMVRDMTKVKNLCKQQVAGRSTRTTAIVSSSPTLPAISSPASTPKKLASTDSSSPATMSTTALLSRGEGSDDLMSARPDWLNDYIDFHRSSVESDGNGGHRVKEGVPFLVYECTGENKCGGIGDRINSMVLVVYLSMCSGRVLLINSPYPSPLQNFLEPNLIRWDALPPEDMALPTLDIMDARNNDLLVDTSTIGYKLGRCNGMPARHTLRSIFANQCMSDFFSKHREEIFPYPGAIPQESLLRWSFFSLFKFSDAVLSRADELKKSAGLSTGAPYHGIHIRTGDVSMGIDNMRGVRGPRSQYRNRDQTRHGKCYQKLKKAHPAIQVGYVASDADDAKQLLNEMDKSILYSNEIEIFHVDETMRGEDLASVDNDLSYRGSLDGWAELVVLADSKCVIMSWSMLSFAAHYLGGDNRCGIFVEDCMEVDLAVPHEYAYEAGKSEFELLN